MRRTTSALTTAVLGGVLTASFVWARQPGPDDDSARSSTAASPSAGAETGSDSDPLSAIPVHRGARYLMRNGLDYLKYQQYDRALGFLREAESRQKELNEPEKRLLKQGIERARQGLRMASNAESPYALSEQSRHRNGFVPARADARPAPDQVKTASAVPSASKTTKRVMGSKSADLELNRADAEEPIRLTSNEVVTNAPAAPTETAQDPSADGNRRANLPQIPKFSAVPAWNEVPTGVAQQTPAPSTQPATAQAKSEEPAPLALAAALPPIGLPAASAPAVGPAPAPVSSPAEPAQSAPSPVQVQVSPLLADVAPPPAALAAPTPAPDQRPVSEQPLLILNNPETPAAAAAATTPSGPAPALTLAEAVAQKPTEPTPVSTTPDVVTAPSASGEKATLGASSASSEGLALSTPPASGEAPAAPPTIPAASPAVSPAETSAAPAQPLASTPSAAPSGTTSQDPAPLVTTPPVVSITQGTDRVTDQDAMRAANAAPSAAAAPAVDSLPTLPDELGRAAEVSALPSRLDRPEAGATPAAAETLPPLDNALPPLPVDLGSPTRPVGELPTPAASAALVPENGPMPTSPVAANPSVPAAPLLENSEPTSTAAPTPIEVAPQPAAAPAPSASPTETELTKATASAESTPPPIGTQPTTAAVSEVAGTPAAEPAVSQTPPVTATTASDATLAAPGEIPNSRTSDATRQPGDPFMPERRPEVSNLQPRLRREVEEIARKMENDLQSQAGGAAAPATPVRDTSPTDLKTQFQLDISRAPSPAEARPIKAIPVPEDWVPLGQRNWAPQRKYWAAAATCHLPLYFQDPMLERYGHNVEQFVGPVARYLSYPVDDPRQSTQNNQVIQPFFSAGLMALQIVALPYNLVMDPPWEAQYDLGYYRPGDLVPTDTYWLPLHGYGPPLRGNSY